LRMDHPVGYGDEDARRGGRRIRKPVLDKRTGKDGASAKKDDETPPVGEDE
jgi:hypothetical protein